MSNMFNFRKFARRLAPGRSRLLRTSAVIVAVTISSLAATMPTKADIVDTFTISPGATIQFIVGGLDIPDKSVTGTFLVDITSGQIESGTATLVGPAPQSGVYQFGVQSNTLPEGSATSGPARLLGLGARSRTVRA